MLGTAGLATEDTVMNRRQSRPQVLTFWQEKQTTKQAVIVYYRKPLGTIAGPSSPVSGKEVVVLEGIECSAPVPLGGI